MNSIRRAIAGTVAGAILTVGAITAAAPAQAANAISNPERNRVSHSTSVQHVQRGDLTGSLTGGGGGGLLAGLGLGGIADTVCDLLTGLLGSNKMSSGGGGGGLTDGLTGGLPLPTGGLPLPIG